MVLSSFSWETIPLPWPGDRTRAALNVLPEKETLKKYLGQDFERIARDYCWMADWREAVRPDHFVGLLKSAYQLPR